MESTVSLGNCTSCDATAKFHLQNPFGVHKVTYPDFSVEYFGHNNTPNGFSVEMCNHFVTPDGKKYDHARLFKLITSM